MIHKVKTTWKDKMAFDSQIDNHVVRIDTASPDGDDTGPSPKKLLLASLAGCTGMDVVSFMKKMRIPFTDLEMDIEADLTEEYPQVYSEIRLTYRIYGHQLNKEKVQKAVDLSKDKYCGVSAMLKNNSPIVYTVEYIEESK